MNSVRMGLAIYKAEFASPEPNQSVHHEHFSGESDCAVLAQTFERVLRSEHQSSLKPVRKHHAKHYVTCVA